MASIDTIKNTLQPTAIAGSAWPNDAPHAFHLLAKPSGSTCNIDCSYCFFLSKEALYPDQRQRMSDGTLETYIRQLLESHQAPKVQVTWQGGEPTLMQLAFFQRAVELVERHRRPGQIIEHSIQTNGTLLDDDWCRFFKQHRFLVGLSVDGPRELHDRYRVDRLGHGTFSRVLQGWRHLRRHGVEFNILCTIHAANQQHGRAIYRFLRDELDARWIQFIPIVERIGAQVMSTNEPNPRRPQKNQRLLYTQSGHQVTQRSVDPTQYGQFLVDVFEEWVRHDVGRVFVQQFDVALEACFGRHLLCVHAPDCGYGPALEYNGDLYCCDHYVEPNYLLGNIHQTHMLALVAGDRQRAFVQHKRKSLSAKCRQCAVLQWCHGGCPKDRFVPSPEGDADQNYLCPGYAHFFSHARPAMQCMVDLLQRGRPALGVMAWMTQRDAAGGPYQACSCGSGRKLRFCHGERAPTSPFEGVAACPSGLDQPSASAVDGGPAGV